jgi:hypothetical protein
VTEKTRLATILDTLTEQWRERRADVPLEMLARAWPSSMEGAAQWQSLWQALNRLQGIANADLPQSEVELLAEARRLVNSSLRAVGGTPY